MQSAPNRSTIQPGGGGGKGALHLTYITDNKTKFVAANKVVGNGNKSGSQKKSVVAKNQLQKPATTIKHCSTQTQKTGK